MRWPEDISKQSRIESRSRQAYQNTDIAPRSRPPVASHSRCEAIRLSSMWITRRYWARLGTSRSSSVSTEPQ